jgi:hypothetical protein
VRRRRRVNPGESAGGVLGGGVILAGGEGDELQRGGPPGDVVLEIGSQQLAFTHQEAKQFFDCRLTSPIEADDSSHPPDNPTDGWR